MNVALIIVAYLVYFERKVAAHMQARMGPNRAGPIGLFQSFADLIKMLRKENTVPADSDKVVFFIAPLVSTLASVGLPTTSGFTGEFLALLGAFTAAWPRHLAGNDLPLVLAVVAVSGVVLGALYMLRFALTFLYGPAKAPHTEGHALADLDGREKTILALIVVAVFALGLFPAEPLAKTELAAKGFQQLVTTPRLPAAKP